MKTFSFPLVVLDFLRLKTPGPGAALSGDARVHTGWKDEESLEDPANAVA